MSADKDEWDTDDSDDILPSGMHVARLQQARLSLSLSLWGQEIARTL